MSGAVIKIRDELLAAAYFIGLGAEEFDTASQKLCLGRGEMVAQLSLIRRQPRRTALRALTHGVLFGPDEARPRTV